MPKRAPLRKQWAQPLSKTKTLKCSWQRVSLFFFWFFYIKIDEKWGIYIVLRLYGQDSIEIASIQLHELISLKSQHTLLCGRVYSLMGLGGGGRHPNPPPKQLPVEGRLSTFSSPLQQQLFCLQGSLSRKETGSYRNHSALHLLSWDEKSVFLAPRTSAHSSPVVLAAVA